MNDEVDKTFASQARIRQQIEEQQQAVRDLCAWEDAIQKQAPKNSVKGEEGSKVLRGKDIRSNLTPIGPREPVQANNQLRNDEDQERIRGNSFYTKGNYEDAIRSYSKCIMLNPTSAVAYSNRAMAHLKLKDWNHAEEDATRALEIDPLHTKSYQRRSSARAALGKLRAAMQDLNMAEMAASKTGVTGIGKDIVAEKQKLEKLLEQAMEKAPKRKVPIELVTKTDDTIPENCNRIKKDTNKQLFEDTIEGEMTAVHTTRKNVSRNATTILVANELKHDTMQTSVIHKKSSVPVPMTKMSSEVTSPQKFRTWYEFEHIWKSYSSDQKSRIDLIKRMKPQDITKLYKRNGMEDSNIFLDLIQCACALDHGGASYISAISDIPSIDMVVMMLSKQEKDLLRQLLASVRLPSQSMKGICKRFAL